MEAISRTQSRLGSNAFAAGVVHFLRESRGGASVELAVVLPLLALLVIGVADFSRAFVAGSVVAHAAKAGAQYAAQGPGYAADTASIRSAAARDAEDLSSVTVASRTYCNCGGADISCSTGSCGSYGPPRMFVAVTASKTFRFILRYPGLPGSMPISKVATLRVQ